MILTFDGMNHKWNYLKGLLAIYTTSFLLIALFVEEL